MFQDYLLLHFLFNVLRLLFISFDSMFQDFSSLSHTQKTICISIHHFHFYSFIYTCPYPFMPSHLKYFPTKNDVIYLQPFNDTLHNSNIKVLFDPNLYELATKEGGLNFLFSDSSLQF